MGKLNIQLPSLPEQVRPEIRTPLLMPSNKTKGEIEARSAQSRSSQHQVQGVEKKAKEVDLDKERLIRSAKGPSLSRWFEELLSALKASLNNNHFTYKKALDKTINFITVIKVKKDNFLEDRIVVNANDLGTYRCMQVSLNFLISRRASELDIFISKARAITREDTKLLTALKDAHVAAFPEAYLQPSKGITYICPTTKQFGFFNILKQCVRSNEKLIMILGTSLKAKKNKNHDDMEMIKLLRRYLDNAEVNLPKTQFNNNDLDDDEHKKSDQNPSGSNPSQSSKPSGSKGGEKKKKDDKKDEEKKRRGERKSRKPHDDSGTQTILKIQIQPSQTLAQPTTSTISNIKPSQTSKPKFLYRQTANSFLKIPITSSHTNLKKMTILSLSKPSLKFKLKSVGRKPKKVKPAKEAEIIERAICNCFKEFDFLPLNWCTSYEDHFQHSAEEIVKIWIVSLREVGVYFKDGTFTLLDKKLMDSLTPAEIKRVLSLLKGKDTVTRTWRSSLAEWLIEREETKKRDKAEAEERRSRHAEEIDMFIKRSEELKVKGMSRISKDGRFLNIKVGGFSRFSLEYLDQDYPKATRQKLMEALSGTLIIEELEILDHLKDKLREEADVKTVFT
ncbi:hypothetical protein AgCh_001072 [Apium graveolens]